VTAERDGNGSRPRPAEPEGVEVLWYLTGPDGRAPWSASGSRKIDLPYLRQVAGAVDQLGYTGALLATGAHDTWVLGSSLITATERMRFLIAVHPPLISPVLAAKMATTFDQFSDGRLILNIVNGATQQLRGFGSTLGHDERYAHTDEWIPVWRAAAAGAPLDFEGDYVTAQGPPLPLPAVQAPTPPLWFGGSSPAALRTAAKHIDTYLSWGEPPPQTAERIAHLRTLAAEYGRTLRFGIRLYLLVRDTDEQAWAEANRLLRTMDSEVVEKMQRIFKGTDSVGQQRMLALHGGRVPDDARELEVYPDLWAGLGLVRPGPGTAIVGSPETVLARIQEYRDAGISTFIVSGIPLLEEAYRVAETILPHLPVTYGSTTARDADVDASAFAWTNLTKEGTLR
jgi:alkanesulfonate monooxygenase